MTDHVAPTADNIRPIITRILAISGVAFVFLLWLLYFKADSGETSSDTLSMLPAVNAGLNGTVTILIIGAVIAIKNGKRKLHMGMMITAIILSVTFLASYILYHSIHGNTPFVTEGAVRYLYFGILISHVACTVFALPLIMSSVFFAATKRYALHRKVVKFTVPFWLYVSVTGVVIYFLLKANS
jgi:putative membrane protein